MKQQDCLLTVYWQNYTYKEGPHTCRGTKYYRDKKGVLLWANDRWHARRKDGPMKMGGFWVYATKLEQ